MIGDSSQMYYIQNTRSNTDNMIFWRVNGEGYTSDLDEAWKVSYERATRICSDRPEEDVPHTVASIDSLAKRRVDVHAVLKSALTMKPAAKERNE